MKMKNPNMLRSSPCARSGSALLTAMIFSFIIGALAVTFLKLATSEYRSAVRSTLYSSSLNLAESGVEMAIEALSSNSTSGSTWSKRVTNYLTDEAYSGDVKLVVFDADKLAPTVYAQGSIHGHPSGDVVKQVRVTLSSGFQPYAKGFSARNGITFSGDNVYLDSYNSNYGDYDAELDARAPFDYGVDGHNKNDDIYVASDSVNVTNKDTISQGNADVYGYVSIGPDSTISIGPNGSVTSYDSGVHDESRITGDFYADFPSESQPLASGNTTYSNISGFTILQGSDDPNNPTQYDVSEIKLNGGGDSLVISGHVELLMSGDISVSGTGGVYIVNGSVSDSLPDDVLEQMADLSVDTSRIKTDSSLQIYTPHDVSIAGSGVTNFSGVPLDFKVYGTADSETKSGDIVAGQTISISGNGQLAATVYAPNAEVSLNGGGSSGEVLGGLVAFTATITGDNGFHFDEALRDIIIGGGEYSIESWLEMTGATAASTPIDMSAY